jgi:hypothetical protein
MSYVHAVKSAVMEVWIEEPEELRAQAIASAIFDIRPLPEDWFRRWNGSEPPNWITAVRRALLAGFALPIEIADHAKARAYHEWLNTAAMSDLRALSPEMYQQVVEYLRNFVQTPWDKNDGD